MWWGCWGCWLCPAMAWPNAGIGEAVSSLQGHPELGWGASRADRRGQPGDWPGQLRRLNASPGHLRKRAVRRCRATGFLLMVIQSLANGLQRKKSHEEDLSRAPIPDLLCEGTQCPDPGPRARSMPLGGEQSRESRGPAGTGWGGVAGGWRGLFSERRWQVRALCEALAASDLTVALGRRCCYC